MKSPFPGMDPYLEQHWRDVRHNLITFAQGIASPGQTMIQPRRFSVS